jgi:hypothetical protein
MFIMRILFIAFLLAALWLPAFGQSVVSQELKASDWIAEFEDSSASQLSVAAGTIEVTASAGATIWYKQKISGNVGITYDVVVIDSGARTDRVSDLNAFWMASDPKQVTPFGRNGKFPSYDNLDLYYAGVGGNENTTSRFRRYHHGLDKKILQEYTDKQHLLQGNRVYSVNITVRDGRTTFSINGAQYFQFDDDAPLTVGYFAFRTTRSHLRITHFKIEKLSP